MLFPSKSYNTESESSSGKINTIIKIVDICNNETEPTFTIQNVYDGEATLREVIPQIYLTYYENFINLKLKSSNFCNNLGPRFLNHLV